ncbi:MAG: hypothetical protein PHR00_01940 [Patescibacteria group bacterium]|nr:hypothetical protein [Patescibacteria group bacterium]
MWWFLIIGGILIIIYAIASRRKSFWPNKTLNKMFDAFFIIGLVCVLIWWVGIVYDFLAWLSAWFSELLQQFTIKFTK